MKAAEIYQTDLGVSLLVVESELKTWFRLTTGNHETQLLSLVGLAKELLLPSVRPCSDYMEPYPHLSQLRNDASSR